MKCSHPNPQCAGWSLRNILPALWSHKCSDSDSIRSSNKGQVNGGWSGQRRSHRRGEPGWVCVGRRKDVLFLFPWPLTPVLTAGNLSPFIRPEEFLSKEPQPTFSLQDVIQLHQGNQQSLKPRCKLTDNGTYLKATWGRLLSSQRDCFPCVSCQLSTAQVDGNKVP